MHELPERRAGHLPGPCSGGRTAEGSYRGVVLPLRETALRQTPVLRPMPRDQKQGDGAAADDELQKVACYEKSRREPLKTLSEKRPFSPARVHQARAGIFRNIGPLEAHAQGGASGLRDDGALLWCNEGVRRLSELLAAKGSR